MRRQEVGSEVRFLGTAATDRVGVRREADAYNRVQLGADGKLEFGSGAIAADTNLYRGGASALKTDDSFQAALGAVPSGGALTAATLAHFIGGAPPVALTGGTSTQPTAGTIYFGSLWLPANMTLTGVGYNIGGTGGTDKVITALYDRAGVLLANSDLAGVTVGTQDTMQEVAFTATYDAKGPELYYVALQFNGNTARFRVGLAVGVRAGSQAGAFATLAAIASPPVANAGAPIGYVY